MRKNQIVIKKAKNKEFFLRVKAANNETVATTETYKKIQGAKKAAGALKKILKNAVVVDKTSNKK